jgi:hypothetical protein
VREGPKIGERERQRYGEREVTGVENKNKGGMGWGGKCAYSVACGAE